MIFVGNDWAEGHHDVYLLDEGGTRLGSGRLPEGIEDVARFYQMVAEHTTEVAEVVVGVETDRGLWVGALIGAGYQVYAINPMAVSRYRDRHRLGGAKSDRGDAKVLADLVRTDRHNHRPVAGDSPGADGIKVLARAHQNLIWSRARHTNGARSAGNLLGPGRSRHRRCVGSGTHPHPRRPPYPASDTRRAQSRRPATQP